jgi:hypothetical protein
MIARSPPKQIYQYELLPVSPVPSLPLYPDGTLMRHLGNGRTAHVEIFKNTNDVFIGDRLVSTLKDWLIWEPVEMQS